MISINHPALGAALSVDPLAAPGWRTIEPRYPAPAPPIVVRSIAVPASTSVTPPEPFQQPNPPNLISPPVEPASGASIPEPPAAASIPASASATGSAAPADTSAPFSLSDWLSAETLFPGYPNGLVAAGGVIALAWLFGGKKGRR
jgi:hypothetical protein